ncbi:DUF503 domain-containing protein [Globicatella sp. PHS-GS-PNBC-21-1553]|uniref:DUF503 domain-containing protein n=1 Tax=Globicatella sp. PHS-GS-PNBC-21-1553 TaxID=2885764 RepID=UPI00298EFCFC|nr:DUF503 domain-containing protein [Globicatella sp. PHS-GS-PNBC-21-1553]WPC07768.1 DUF503 domain-containing protein [Globicatella sp. PHS-GS-PNBC-21-1553]
MLVLVMAISIKLPYANSLKDKRSIRQSLVSQLKKGFSVSVRETAHQEDYQQLHLSLALVCLSELEGEQYAQRIEDFLYDFTLDKSCELQNAMWDILVVE